MKIVDIDDPKYPPLLKQIPSRPDKLYYKGQWDEAIFAKCLAVVGSRRMTTYGRQVTTELVEKAALEGITIVSGFMYGVDAQAHRAALKAKGRTIAVMPCGIDLIHPAYQEDLYWQILNSRGLIISESEGQAPPAKWSYPRRNRIVAGLSQATLVIEAALGSGSLITAGLARKFKRKLFAVPGPLTSSVSRGTLQLIKEGAVVVTNIDDILSLYGLDRQKKVKFRENQFKCLGRLEKEIINILSREPKEIDYLSRQLKIASSKLGAVLSLMKLKGFIGQERGKYYVGKSFFGS